VRERISRLKMSTQKMFLIGLRDGIRMKQVEMILSVNFLYRLNQVASKCNKILFLVFVATSR